MMPTLYAAPGCPYAQRATAMLTLLEVPFTLNEVDLRNKSAEFLALSPTGKVPLLQDDDLLLYESDIIATYLAEVHGFDGLPDDAGQRARHRLAMKQFDSVVGPAWVAALSDPKALEGEALLRELGQIEATVRDVPPASSLGLHMATHYVRWTWTRHLVDMVGVIEGFPTLHGFLKAAAALPAVQATSPDRDATVAMFEAWAASMRR